MFLALLVCQFALAAASPFHKYPYVFLLDIGNEELEKTNTEQIRVSAPGGSLALRYPAIGDGDTISHVRVSGIDFGTDLKANILDGGPGYKYVVLVFMGNPGTPYDAVMTIHTVSDSSINDTDDSNRFDPIDNSLESAEDSSEITGETPNVETNKIDDANDSAEDLSDDAENKSVGNKNSEIIQESSNIYNYVENEPGYDSQVSNDNAANEVESDEKDIHNQYSVNNEDKSLNDYEDESDVNEQNDQDEEPKQIESEDSETVDDSDKSTATGDNNAYEPYAVLRPIFYDGIRIYPQNRVPFVLRENRNPAYNPEDSVEFDQMFNDEDDHSQSDKLRDSNNNNFDTDDSSAVAS